MTVRETIVSVVTGIARQQHKKLQPLNDELPLLDSGLDSLCLAIIVANLEKDLGIDPFSASDDVEIPATFGQFVALYENAFA